jgi:hypothetical protein
MIRSLFLIAVVFMQLCLPAGAGWFGPSNYDECILDSMKGVTSNSAAILIKEACRKKFPDNPKPNVSSHELLPEEIFKIAGRAGLSYGNVYSGNLYNGNSSLTVTNVSIEISISACERAYTNVIRSYKVDVDIPPLTAKDFKIDIIVGDAGCQYTWKIAHAQGY